MFNVSLMFIGIFCLNHRKMSGKDAPRPFTGTLPGVSKYSLGGETNVSVTVNNVLVDTKIYNVFGVIKGFVDPGEELEHYVLMSVSVFGVKSVFCFCRSLRGARRSERCVQPRVR